MNKQASHTDKSTQDATHKEMIAYVLKFSVDRMLKLAMHKATKAPGYHKQIIDQMFDVND